MRGVLSLLWVCLGPGSGARFLLPMRGAMFVLLGVRRDFFRCLQLVCGAPSFLLRVRGVFPLLRVQGTPFCCCGRRACFFGLLRVPVPGGRTWTIQWGAGGCFGISPFVMYVLIVGFGSPYSLENPEFSLSVDMNRLLIVFIFFQNTKQLK